MLTVTWKLTAIEKKKNTKCVGIKSFKEQEITRIA